MTALASPSPLQFETTFPHQPMAHPSSYTTSSASLFPPTSQSHQLQQPSYGGTSSAVEEDDLLALLSSDSFSLDSARDRELLLLQSFLKGVIPTASSDSTGHPQPPPPPPLSISPAFPSAVVGGSAQQQLREYAQQGGLWTAGSGANVGWKEGAGEGSRAPYGSPRSFVSTAGMGPSTSLLSNPPMFPPPPSSSSAVSPHRPTASSAFPCSPSAFSSPPPPAPAPRGRGAGLPSSYNHTYGARAPACSRERVPTLSSFGGGEEEVGGGGWKGRLRSSAARKGGREEEESAELEEDAMMMD
ncbi:hypothetical protein JCM11641_001475 [Rhodosporidiobolus odoratus]